MKSVLSELNNNLVNSKSTIARIEIANLIFEHLKFAEFDFGPTERLIREHFIDRVKAFAMNPTAKIKAILTKLVKFYDKNYSYRPGLSLVA